MDMDAEDVGVYWMDIDTDAKPQHCVVIGMDDSKMERNTADDEKTYYVLLVQRKPEMNDAFVRIGAGKIKARYVSSQYHFMQLDYLESKQQRKYQNASLDEVLGRA
ncbi:hypothetical protein LTR17_006128 [Elasticomyces elasticus]|nr:hypothetical protein LTR17_006128 [Elasticomyces elasticus]